MGRLCKTVSPAGFAECYYNNTITSGFEFGRAQLLSLIPIHICRVPPALVPVTVLSLQPAISTIDSILVTNTVQQQKECSQALIRDFRFEEESEMYARVGSISTVE
ncbi:hypothetical protein KQX54_018060 [Cotesia glomerata]|uniref:Uncharacterized protein n=1 Tax=Cotesia glomerata TaxID=32391 RepID=A0AAV7I106_COTGL|nr:hypothetical protein KQX54_018060 [Cotesia glomerata]